MVGSEPRSVSGSASSSRNSAIPIGLPTSRRAYSATVASLVLHSSRPMVGASPSVRSRSSAARQVEVELPRVGRGEPAHLQVNDDVAVQPDVVEEQVEEEVAAADLQVVLAADEGEPGPHLQQELAHVLQQPALQVPLAARLCPA